MKKKQPKYPMVTPEIGDVVEFATKKGLAYAQCTHIDPDRGAVLRILPGFHQAQPVDFGPVLMQLATYSVIVITPIEANPNELRILGPHPIPEHSQAFPIFRNGVRDPRTKRVNCWWLWDGHNQWRVDNLTEDQKRLSIPWIQFASTIRETIESGWSPLDFT